MKDLQYAIRILMKSPGFTSVAVIILALGIGGNAAIFSSVNAVILRPFPFPDLDRVVRIWQTYPEQGATQDMVSPDDYLDWRRQSETIEDLAALNYWSASLTGVDEPEQLSGSVVSPAFFKALRTEPLIGRVFTDEEEMPGRDNVVLLGHGFWMRRFAADPNIVGRQLLLNDHQHTVVGVMPAEFDYPLGTDLWKPLAIAGIERTGQRNGYGLFVVGRLKDGIELDEARAEMESIAARLARDYPGSNEGRGVLIKRIREVTDTVTNRFVLVLLAGSGFVLLLACANVANLQIARVSARGKELALRAALGASRWHIARQLLVENCLLSAAGGIAGLLLAFWLLDLQTAVTPANVLKLVAGLNDVKVDATVLIFTAAIAFLAGLICGIGPVLTGKRHLALNEALKEGGFPPTATGHQLLRRILVVTEIAGAFVLLVGAGLMVQAFQRYRPET